MVLPVGSGTPSRTLHLTARCCKMLGMHWALEFASGFQRRAGWLIVTQPGSPCACQASVCSPVGATASSPCHQELMETPPMIPWCRCSSRLPSFCCIGPACARGNPSANTVSLPWFYQGTPATEPLFCCSKKLTYHTPNAAHCYWDGLLRIT